MKFFLYSLLLHSVMIFLVCTHFMLTTNQYAHESMAAHKQQSNGVKVTAYLLHKAAISDKHVPKQNSLKNLLSSPAQQQAITVQPNQRQILPGSVDAKSSDKLLSILHDLIQKNVQYPHGISVNNVSRETQVGFYLDKNGYIDGVKIINSSGIKVLDMAAFDAVQMLPRIALSETELTLLNSRKYFVVPVIYRVRTEILQK